MTTELVRIDPTILDPFAYQSLDLKVGEKISAPGIPGPDGTIVTHVFTGQCLPHPWWQLNPETGEIL